MAYNPNTRLLLQFDDAPYSLDTSQYARACTFSVWASSDPATNPYPAVGGSMFCDGLNSSGQIGQISVDAPSGLFASVGSEKRIELWYSVDGTQDAGSNGLFNFNFSDGQVLRFYTNSDGSVNLLTTGGTVGSFQCASGADAANAYGTGWHCLRVHISGATVTIGLDGAQVATATHTTGVWGSGTLTEAAFGQGQDYWSHYGTIDSVQVFEGDTSWTGGAFVVPTVRPDDYYIGPVSAPLTGQSYGYSQGAVGAQHPVSAGLVGQSYTHVQRALTARIDHSPSEHRLFGTQFARRFVADDLVPKRGGLDAGSGIANEFWDAPPAASPDVAVGVAGQALLIVQGAPGVIVGGPVTVAVAGQSVPITQGSVVAVNPTRTAGLAGVVVAPTQGSLKAAVSAAVAGVPASPTAGVVTSSRGVPTTGQSVGLAAGVVTAAVAYAPYNASTRLLLKFNETAGTSTVADTSAQARTATFTTGGTVASPQKFGNNVAAVGNPGGTFAASSITVDNPNGVFADGIVPRQFDFWFRLWGYPVTQGNQPLMFIKFANGDTLVFYQAITTLQASFNGTRTVNVSGSSFASTNQWKHYRLLIDGPTLTIGAGGVQIASTTIGTDIWTGSSTNLPIEIRFGSAYDGYYNAQGYLESIEFTEGTVTWAGGPYTIPTSEPTDSTLMPTITGVGANTLEDSTTVWEVVAQDILNGEGANTVEDCVGTGEVVHDAHFAEGANTLDDCLGDGYASEGVVLFADGAGGVEDVQSAGTIVVTPYHRCVGAATLEDVVSVGEGGSGWAVGYSDVVLEGTTTVSEGTVPIYTGPTGVGANTVTTTSSGAGQVIVQGAGANVVTVGSVGAVAKDEQFGVGANTVAVVGAGSAVLDTLVQGWAALQDAVSIGSGYGTLFAVGAADVGVTSLGQGVVPIIGVGWGSTEVFTVDLDGWEPSTSAIYLHVGADVLSLYAQESAMVTT